MNGSSLAVAMALCQGYEAASVHDAVFSCLEAADITVGRGSRVLVKPNLLKATSDGLPCTHPAIVRAACLWLLEQGALPFVADSPGFGSGVSVARRIGLVQALTDLDVPVMDLNRPVRRSLPFGHTVGISRLALEADMIVNVAKLKAHCQMRVTGAVKNLFGCVTGTRKAVAHTMHGDVDGPKGPRFESLIVELAEILPPTVALMDGVTAMHVQGPSGGEPFTLGMLAAAASSVALDTAVYTLLGVEPAAVPLWSEVRRRSLPGAYAKDLTFPLLAPQDFNATGFILPQRLQPMTFHPGRLCISAMRRAWARIK